MGLALATGRSTAAALLLAGACMHASPAQARGFDAEIRWTRYGVPHVKAKDYASLGFGYGYAVATDELCVLADRILTLRGERSRWFGPAGESLVGFVTASNLNSDLFYRVQLAADEVALAERKLSANARDLTAGYAAGYNRFVKDLSADARKAGCNGVALPTMKSTDVLRFMMQIGTIWRSQDIANVTSTSTWEQLNGNASAVEPEKGRAVRLLRLDGEDPIGSNAWAFGADVTGTGAAIVVANPHTSWLPSWQRMHQLHLTIPGEIDVAGADFAGLPVPVAGITRDVSWTIKSPIGVRYHVLLALDVRNDGQRPVYMLDGRARPIDFKTVSLDVRNAAGEVRSQSFRIPYSDLGALYKLNARDGRPAGWYAITDANSGNALGIDQLLAAAKARNLEEFKRAVADHRGITARLIAGDRHGAAMYIESGPLLDVDDTTLRACGSGGKLRSAGASGVLDGTRSECLLRSASGATRLAAASKVPAVTTRGAVQFASTSYRYALFDRLLDGYSLLFGDSREPPGARALMSQRHLAEVLADGRISVAEATDVMFSNRNYAAETTLDAIAKACTRAQENSRAARACSMLASWDRRNDAESKGALLFAQAWPRLQAIPNFYADAFDANRPYRVLAVSTTAQVADEILAVLDGSIQSLEALGLRGDELWGQMLARTTNGGRVPLHGGAADQGVLNVITGGPLQRQGYGDIRYGSSYAHVVTWVEGRLVADVMLSHGQSVDPALAHFQDQLPLFAAKRLVRLPFDDDEIEADPAFKTLRLRQ